jgi:hypothetical protein
VLLSARKNDPANTGVLRSESRPERRGLGFSVAAEHAAANRSVRDWRHLGPLAAAVFLRLTDTARLGETRRWGRILASYGAGQTVNLLALRLQRKLCERRYIRSGESKRLSPSRGLSTAYGHEFTNRSEKMYSESQSRKAERLKG